MLIEEPLFLTFRDSYNLGWKLAGVIRKELNPDILKTYELEQRSIAHELLEAEDLLVAFFNPETDQEQAGAAKERERVGLFLSGLLVQYPATILSVPSQVTKALQPGHIIPGMRLPDVTISNHSTAQRASLLSLLRSDGQFHIVMFAGDIGQLHQRERLNSFGLAIQLIACQVLPPCSSGFNVITIHTARQKAVELDGLHKIFLADQITMHCDNDRVYCNMDVTYEVIGVEDNTIIIVRPDQYVGWRGKIDDVDGLEIYLRRTFNH